MPDEEKETSDRPSGVSRRTFVKILAAGGVIGAAGLVGSALIRGNLPSSLPQERQQVTAASTLTKVQETFHPRDLDDILGSLISGGPPKDGIPAIRNPKYISRAEADKVLRDSDIIFGVDINGAVKAIPRNILNWHEIVDDIIGGAKVAITFCPLTGSPIGYRGRSRVNGEELSFGVSGLLYNSNLVMYDHQTDAYWPQLLGVGIRGPNKGVALEGFHIANTTWAKWKLAYPDTLVLSRDTGHVRDYTLNPYEGYDTSGQVWFPTTGTNSRYPPKKIVTGIRLNEQFLAVPKEEFRSVRAANVILGGQPLAVLYDSRIDTTRAFISKAKDQTLTFKGNGETFVDEETSSTWSPTGVATSGSLAATSLAYVHSFESMWFAWYAFYPETQVLGQS